jgi:lipopolysaccharide transport system ATP-binding protein
MEKMKLTLELKNVSKVFLLKKGRRGASLIKRIRSFSLNKDLYTKSLNKFTALEDINLKFYENEIVGIVGSNGAGKSTLVNIMYGLTEPTTGEVITNKRVVALYGFDSCFNGELTGRENIYLTSSAYGLNNKQIDSLVNEIIEFSEIKEIDIQIKFYSNGMKARLGFSIVAFIDADIFILDESLVGGDVFFQKKCVNKIKDMIKKPNRTFILISHEEGILNDLCSKIIVMNKGKIEFESDTVSGLEYYKRFL